MDFEDVLKFAYTNSNEMVRSYATIVQLELYVIFQKWNEAQALLLKAGDLRPFVPGLYHLVRFSLLEGLISLKAAQLSTSCIERRKWEQRANRIIKMIKTWLQKGNVNVVHTYHILTAEYHVLKKNKAQAEESFKAGAKVAARNGFVQDHALARELAGLYCVENGDEFWATYNFTLAHRTYLDWQAKSKADHLVSQFPKIIANEKLC